MKNPAEQLNRSVGGSEQLEGLYKKIQEYKDMYRLFGDEPLTDKDITRYVKSNEELVKALPQFIESVLKDRDLRGHNTAIDLIPFVPIEAREKLVSLGLYDANVNTRLLAARMILAAPKDAVERLSHEVAGIVGRVLDGTEVLFDDYWNRSSLISMIKYMPETDRSAAIRRGLQDADMEIIYEAAKVIGFAPALEQYGLRQELLDILTRRFDAGDQALSGAFTKMISELPEKSKAKFILRALDDEAELVRRLAVRVISSVVDENERLALFDKALIHKDMGVRSEIVSEIKFVPEKARARLVKELLAEHNREIYMNSTIPLDLVPDVDMEEIRQRLLEVVPYLMSRANTRMRNLGVQMIKYVPESGRAALITLGLGDSDDSTRKDAAYAIEFAPEDKRQELIMLGLNDSDESVRFISAVAIMDISNPKRDELLRGLREDHGVDLQSVASKTRLYDSIDGGFFRSDFKKDGSRTTLLGHVPGFEESASLEGQVIARHITELPYLNWAKAYESLEFWKDKGFDYVPIEPIVAVRQDLSKPEGWGLPVFNVTAFSRVLNGPTVAKWVESFGPFQQEIFDQVDKIRQAVGDLGIKHGHAHLNNFVIMFPRLADGTADITKPPRVYLIDFDAATSTGK